MYKKKVNKPKYSSIFIAAESEIFHEKSLLNKKSDIPSHKHTRNLYKEKKTSGK